MIADLRARLCINTTETVLFDDRKGYFDTKDRKMESLTLKQITYYLIQLFYRTGKKYSCTRTKLGKLLSILAFLYEKNGKSLFEEKIYEYPEGCGTLIKDLTFIPQSIYLRDWNEEDPDGMNEIQEPFDEDVFIPEEYLIKINKDMYNISVEKDIEDVFRRFGAYSGSQLAECLNPIVNKIKVRNTDELNLLALRILDIDEFKPEEKNKVIDYIFL